MVDYKITYVVDNAYAVYHCKSCFIKMSIIATSCYFSRKCPYNINIANSIYLDQTEYNGSVGSVSTLIEWILSTE